MMDRKNGAIGITLFRKDRAESFEGEKA